MFFFLFWGPISSAVGEFKSSIFVRIWDRWYCVYNGEKQNYGSILLEIKTISEIFDKADEQKSNKSDHTTLRKKTKPTTELYTKNCMNSDQQRVEGMRADCPLYSRKICNLVGKFSFVRLYQIKGRREQIAQKFQNCIFGLKTWSRVQKFVIMINLWHFFGKSIFSTFNSANFDSSSNEFLIWKRLFL